MDLKKAQILLLEDMCDGEAMIMPIDHNKALYLLSGGVGGYVIPDDLIALNKEMFTEMPSSYRLITKNENDCLLKPTDTAYAPLHSFVARKYTGAPTPAYVQEELLGCFEDPQLYSSGGHDRVLVYENGELKGVVLPVKAENLMGEVIK